MCSLQLICSGRPTVLYQTTVILEKLVKSCKLQNVVPTFKTAKKCFKFCSTTFLMREHTFSNRESKFKRKKFFPIVLDRPNAPVANVGKTVFAKNGKAFAAKPANNERNLPSIVLLCST